MTRNLPNYLGSPASIMLSQSPFNSWPIEKSFEYDLEDPIIHYVFPMHGLELRCDREDRISTIFLYSDRLNGFDESLLDAPFSLNRQQVMERFGSPSKSGGKISDPILGEYGPWDRFAQPGYTLHFQYRVNADSIEMITLTRTDSQN